MVDLVKIKVRGIYSTAITKLLVENGFEIANPSSAINERFSIENKDHGADVLVYDKEDSNGVTINGNGAEKITEVMQSQFLDTLIRKSETGAIYLGKIKQIENKFKNIFVDLGNGEEGVLNLQNYWGFLKEGEKVLVQVKGTIFNKKILSTQLRLFGDNTILIKGGFTKVSKNISSSTERERLLKISKQVTLDGWGILWKAQADGKSDAELVSEINRLVEDEKNLNESFKQKNEPGLIKPGTCTYFVDFGSMSKHKLDKIRSKVLHTITGHHFLKAGGYATLADFAESLQVDDEIITKKINKVLMDDGPKPSMWYTIIHKKPSGRDVVFNGIVETATEEEVVIKRFLRSGGRLDGIGGTIDEGDYAITKIKPGNWYIVHKYFNKEGFPKGVYININTPVEIYPRVARYIDLEVDVVERADKREIIDMEKLERAIREKMISKQLSEKAIEVANQLLKEELK